MHHTYTQFAAELAELRQRNLKTDGIEPLLQQSWWRLCICGVTAAMGCVQLFNSLTSLAVLNAVATHYPVAVGGTFHILHSPQHYDAYVTNSRRSLGRLTFVAVMKLFLSAGCLGASVALEYHYRLTERYVVIGMQLFASGMALASAFADIHALVSDGQYLLGLKTCVGRLRFHR